MNEYPGQDTASGSDSRISRRTLLKGAGLAAFTGIAGAGCRQTPVSEKHRIPLVDYKSIGVRPLINCKGTYTILSGSLMLPEVKAAMMEAANHYVPLDELMERVGRRLAQLTGAEWGMISAGANACQFGAACACVAGSDPEKMALLPDTRGMKNEIITPKSHRNVYDRAFLMVGTKMITVDSPGEMEAAVNKRTAMIAVLGDQSDRGNVLFEDIVSIARKHNVPVVVDAAAERPDVPNIYLEGGADLVIYSGGKCLRGPQSSGLMLGRKDLCQAAFLNLAPHHALGRPMKCGKEEIMGLLAAVDLWINGRDHEAEWQEWLKRFDHITKEVTTIPTVETEVINPRARSNYAPTLSITWDQSRVKITPAEVAKKLDEGDPRIQMPAGRDGMRIMSYMTEPNEEIPIAKRLKEVLSAAVQG